MKPLPIIAAAFLITTPLWSGCHAQRAAVSTNQTEPMMAQLTLQSTQSTSTEGEWGDILFELLAFEYPQAPQPQNAGPSLIAGDWLAVQCAIAGGYWDMPVYTDTPAYAEVPESWFGFDQ